MKRESLEVAPHCGEQAQPRMLSGETEYKDVKLPLLLDTAWSQEASEQRDLAQKPKCCLQRWKPVKCG